MTRLLVSIDVGGTLGHAANRGLAAILADASPLGAAQARRLMRHNLHTRSEITDEVVTETCALLRIPVASFPRALQPAALILVPGARDALQAMSLHARVVTLSNVTCADSGIEQLRRLTEPWITDHFPSCRIGYAKPDPAAFQTVARACAFTTADMVHLGDDWECDVLGATSVGATAIWISHGRPVPDETMLVDSHVLVAVDLLAASRLVTDLAAARRRT
jgi:FMN hydrolase / 5-amino-6-(5-phospho-D-ribitylamino)uracil phosphatase